MNYHPLLKGYANGPILFDMSESKPISLFEKNNRIGDKIKTRSSHNKPANHGKFLF